MDIANLVTWMQSNPAAAAAVIWPVLSAVVNLLLKQHTVEEWVELAEKRPRTAALIKFIRGAGLDPRKALAALVAFINGKAENLHPPSQPRAKTGGGNA